MTPTQALICGLAWGLAIALLSTIWTRQLIKETIAAAIREKDSLKARLDKELERRDNFAQQYQDAFGELQQRYQVLLEHGAAMHQGQAAVSNAALTQVITSQAHAAIAMMRETAHMHATVNGQVPKMPVVTPSWDPPAEPVSFGTDNRNDLNNDEPETIEGFLPPGNL